MSAPELVDTQASIHCSAAYFGCLTEGSHRSILSALTVIGLVLLIITVILLLMAGWARNTSLRQVAAGLSAISAIFSMTAFVERALIDQSMHHRPFFIALYCLIPVLPTAAIWRSLNIRDIRLEDGEFKATKI